MTAAPHWLLFISTTFYHCSFSLPHPHHPACASILPFMLLSYKLGKRRPHAISARCSPRHAALYLFCCARMAYFVSTLYLSLSLPFTRRHALPLARKDILDKNSMNGDKGWWGATYLGSATKRKQHIQLWFQAWRGLRGWRICLHCGRPSSSTMYKHNGDSCGRRKHRRYINSIMV